MKREVIYAEEQYEWISSSPPSQLTTHSSGARLNSESEWKGQQSHLLLKKEYPQIVEHRSHTVDVNEVSLLLYLRNLYHQLIHPQSTSY